jgi:NAD(P)-dependent dehydrogenase (short-subunit alcohol dehydrogenase family)
MVLITRTPRPRPHAFHVRGWAIALCGDLILIAAALFAVSSACAQPEAAPPTVLITGSNRGIGLEFARQYAALGWRVIATVRDPDEADALRAIQARHPSVVIERLDVTDQAQVDALAAKYREQPIDVLLNNAGLLTGMERQSLETIDFALFERLAAVNSVGPMRVSRAFLPNVLASRQKIIVALSSAASSHGMINMPSPLYAYRASKAALNMLMHILATDLADRGVRVALLNPGLVDTRGVMALKEGDPVPEEFRNAMPAIRSGQLVLITPEESVRNMLQRIRELTPEQSGSFLNYDGRVLPW